MTNKKENDTILYMMMVAGGFSAMGLIESVYGKTLAFIGGFVVLFTIGYWVSRQFLLRNIVDYNDFKKRKTDDIFITVGFQIEDILKHSNNVFRIVAAGLWIQVLLMMGIILVKFMEIPYPRDWILIGFTIGCIVSGAYWVPSAFLELKTKQFWSFLISVGSWIFGYFIVVQEESLIRCIVYSALVLVLSTIFQFSLIFLFFKEPNSLMKQYAVRLIVDKIGFEYGFFLKMVTKKGEIFDAEKDFIMYPIRWTRQVKGIA